MSDADQRRYLPFSPDFDTRAKSLSLTPTDQWDENAKKFHLDNQLRTKEQLMFQFGIEAHDAKIQNFVDIGIKPFSIVGYHNIFFQQSRVSFIMGAYFAALTSTCALGERLLNHLILDLRQDYVDSKFYKYIYRKKSFDDWDFLIKVLLDWDVFTQEVATFS